MIWPLKKRNPRILKEIAPDGLHDLHSHVLCGLDDGASNIEESHAMLKGLNDIGYVQVAATPHCNHRMFPTPSIDLINSSVVKLNESRGNKIPVVMPGGEIMFGENVLFEIENDIYPRLGSSRVYLLEFGSRPGEVPIGMADALFKLNVKQITIVLAHVERCSDLRRNRGLLESFIKAGAIAQMDIMSLINEYGREARETAWDLLECGLVDVVSTDLHNFKDLPKVSRGLLTLAEWNAEEFVRITSVNPSLVLNGDPQAVERHE